MQTLKLLTLHQCFVAWDYKQTLSHVKLLANLANGAQLLS